MTLPDAGRRQDFATVDAIFDALLELPRHDWTAHVQRACAGDERLKRLVERLIAAHDAAAGFLEEPAVVVAVQLLLDPPRDRTGEMIARYRVIRPLGRGGMASVWLAHDPQLDREVALKVVDATMPLSSTLVRATNPSSTTTPMHEAQLVARVDHPHVAGIYDVGHTEDGALWFAMPHCPGGSLADRLRRERVSIPEVIRIMRELVSAISATHAAGVTHRDVKPANVLFDVSGRVRLADFGIAQQHGPAGSTHADLAGTVAYLSPEQVAGWDVDHRTDFWSLGVTLYEMLAGRRPFDGESALEVMRAIAEADPVPVVSAPPVLNELARRLLSKAPADRPAASDILRALEQAQRKTASPVRARARVGFSAVVLGSFAFVLLDLQGEPLVAPMQVASPAAVGPMLPSVAVLPFENAAGDPADRSFTDGLTADVTLMLGGVPGLQVSSSTSALALRGQGLSPQAMAERLGTATTLEATVRRDADRLHVDARLVDARSGDRLWTQQFDEPIEHVFALQQRIADAVVAVLAPSASLGGPRARAPVDRPRTGSIEAYELHLRALDLRQRRTEAGLALAVRTFEQAIAHDSAFADAWAGLANTYVMQVLFSHGRPDSLVSLARQAALHALTLDYTAADAYVALGHLRRIYDFDWQGSLEATSRAMALSPGNELARLLHGITLLHLRRFDDAERVLQEARVLNPVDYALLFQLGRLHAYTGRFTEAHALFQSCIQLNPYFSLAYLELGYLELQRNQPEEALLAFRRAAAMSGARDSAHLAYALAVTGHEVEARDIVRSLERSQATRYVPPMGVAAAYTGLGDHDRAFRWLERAWSERAPFLEAGAVHPSYTRLYADPRWKALMRRLGLPE